jgi:membrane-bound serine protease (ClpP class)
MGKKVENFTAAFGSSIADRRGRNVEWAEKAVRESVTAKEKDAVANRVVDFVATDLADLLRKSSGREVEVADKKQVLDFAAVFDAAGEPRVIDVEMTLRQRVVQFVSDPNIAYLLMMIAMLAIYIELSNPGLVLPGVAGAICLLLVLLAAQLLPINATGALLIAVGMGFIVAELFYPSFGSLGVGGVIALALGSLFLYTPESGLFVDRRLIAGAVGSIGAFVALVAFVLVADRRRQPLAGGEGMIGGIGQALTDLEPKGTIRIRGEIWNAVSTKPVAAGGSVRIIRLDGLVASVEPHPVASDEGHLVASDERHLVASDERKEKPT